MLLVTVQLDHTTSSDVNGEGFIFPSMETSLGTELNSFGELLTFLGKLLTSFGVTELLAFLGELLLVSFEIFTFPFRAISLG